MILAVYHPEEEHPQPQEQEQSDTTTLGILEEGDEDYMRNMTVYIRPLEDTVLTEPEPSPCRQQEITLVLAVLSAPANFLARSTIRRSWGEKILEYPGVTMFFLLGRDYNDSKVHVSSPVLNKEYNLYVKDPFPYLCNPALNTNFLTTPLAICDTLNLSGLISNLFLLDSR